MVTAKRMEQAGGLISYYQKQYKHRFGSNQVLNRNKLKYPVAEILTDLSTEQVKALIDFYVKTDVKPSLQQFCFEYDEVYDQMRLQDEDKSLRRSLMDETRKSVEEYRKRYNK